MDTLTSPYPLVNYAICHCGLNRLLPLGIQPGDQVKLAPCPQCSVPLEGVFSGRAVTACEWLEHDEGDVTGG